MKNFIPRPHYMKKIAPFMNKDIIKVIIGQRRVGKSYFMYQIIDALKKANPRANIIDEAIGKQYEGIAHIHIREFLSAYR